MGLFYAIGPWVLKYPWGYKFAHFLQVGGGRETSLDRAVLSRGLTATGLQKLSAVRYDSAMVILMKAASGQISVDDAAELIGCSTDHVRKLCRDGVLQAQKLGRLMWLIDAKSAHEFADNRPPIGRPPKKKSKGS
jgi:excisionase family DNA binding protein